MALIVIGLFSLANDVCAVSVSVDPSSIASDFAGKISLTVAGVAVGKTVLVERFVDVNGNGTVDPSQDVLILSVKVTDGRTPIIGGVRNANVPGDDDAIANGTIRADLPFPGIDTTIGVIAAKFIFRVSDPQNSFTPVTAVFEVTPVAQPQGISGQITAATGAPLPGTFVGLTRNGGGPISSTFTDSNGHYSLFTPPGPFVLLIFQKGFVSDRSAGAVTVAPNQFATKNVALNSAGFTISGKVSESSGGAGIPGIFVTAEGANFFGVGLTDSSGNYSLAVIEGEWQIRPAENQLAQGGYLRPQKVTLNTTGNGAATINFAAPKATALIYGRVTDDANNPVSGLGVDADSPGSLYKGAGITYPPVGNYVLGVLGGTWEVEPEGEDLAARGYIGTRTNVTLSAGAAASANLVVLPVTAHLRGQLRDSLGAPIANMGIEVQDLGNRSVRPSSDSNGNFDAGVRGGTWEISLACDDAQSRGYVDVSGHLFNVADGVDQNNIVLTFPVSNATISGSVKDNGGNPIAGVEISASQAINGSLSYNPSCVSTDVNGNYTIRVLGGTWQVSVESNDLNARGFNPVNDQNITISAGIGMANFVATPLPPEIISPLSASGTVGQPFLYQFETRFPATLSVTSLPPGLTFNAGLSVITGIPTATGTFLVTLRASNSSGTDNDILTLTVQAPPPGPVITSSNCATGRTGRAFSFQLQASGGSSATRFAVDTIPPGLELDPSTGLISGTPISDGSFGLAVSAIDGSAITNATVQLTFTSDPTVPIVTSAGSIILTPGQFISYTITADASATFGYIGTDGLVHQGPSSAGLPAGLSFDGINKISGIFNGGPIISGGIHGAEPGKSPDQTGGIITNVQLFATDPSGTGTFPLLSFIAARGAVNISTRLAVGTDANVLIGGFIINGSGTTKTLVRAIGPSLTQFGVPNALQDPMLELKDVNGVTLGSSDNWKDSQENAIGATAIAPSADQEAAVLAYLSPGHYTAIVSGKNNTTGIALVEVYDLGVYPHSSDDARLANISTRGFVDTGDSVIIGGFIIRPQAPATSTRIVARAIGPSLAAFGISGALPNPVLELKDVNGVTLTSNDDWQQGSQADIEEIQKLGFAPVDSRESALITTLPTGQYTGIVRGQNNATGVALVEVYALP